MKKKIIKYSIFYLILISLSFVLQTTFFKAIAVGGVSPNLFIVVIISVSLLKGRLHASIVGVIIGMLCDSLYGSSFGFYSIIYMNVGFFNGYLYNHYYKDNIVLPLTLIALSSFIVNYAQFFFGFVFRGKLSLRPYFADIFLSEMFYTVLVGFVFYHVLYWMLYKSGLGKKES